MKGFYLLTGLLVSSLISFSQTNTFPESGNVGVGTVNPDVAFKVVRTGANPTSEYSSINVTTSGSGNIYGPILYLNDNKINDQDLLLKKQDEIIKDLCMRLQGVGNSN